LTEDFHDETALAALGVIS